MENEAQERKEEEQVQEVQAPVEEVQEAAPPAAAPAPVSEVIVEVSREERLWAMGCHLTALVGNVIPVGSLIAPLVLWLIKKEGNPYIDAQGKEAVNFQISILIYAVVSALLMVIGVGFLLLFAVAVFDLVMVIIAAIKTNSGKDFRYPACIRFIK